MVKSIFLQDGEEIFVDDEDYERVSQYTWSKSYYKRTRKISNNKVGSLSNFIKVDHIQKIKNNNFKKENLVKKNRFLTRKGNYNSSSKYKGVSWSKSKKRWRAYITLISGVKHLGYYTSETKAAIAYNKAVLKHKNGEGYINDIGEDNNNKDVNFMKHNFQNITRKDNKKYKGVRYNKKYKYYYANLFIDNAFIYIGSNKNIDKVALMYNKSVKYIDKDAILNDVPITEELKEFISNWEIPDKIKALKEGAENE